jgi:pimeloyl-ACP methyl ester carboxylesterase
VCDEWGRGFAMDTTDAARVTRRDLPIILIRGFGGLGVEDEKRVAYQGFNTGTVYPGKRGENYIYEGLILKFMKSDWQYHDATNVVGYYAEPFAELPDVPPELARFVPFFSGDKVIVDPAAVLHLVRDAGRVRKSLWVFRYYDLNERNFAAYGAALVRLIDFIRELALHHGEHVSKVNIIAHSMGGLIVREAVQRTYPGDERRADEHINKVVTLGTPHQGISFQLFREWSGLEASEEIERFNPERQADPECQDSYVNLARSFPLDRLLTVVGTNYRTYQPFASALNRVFSVPGEYGPNYNRSDGLVKQAYAQIPGAPRTFVHKCHGGADSLVTARESYEVATRFFFGDVRAELRLVAAEVTAGLDWFGRSEVFLGVSIKPRGVDFDLFHQSREAENCYGPFRDPRFGDEQVTFPMGERGLLWEGWLDTGRILQTDGRRQDIVLRLDVYVGERDLLGVGFSDNVVFRKQYYVRAVLGDPLRLYLHTDASFAGADLDHGEPCRERDGGWEFDVRGTGFAGTFRIDVHPVPEDGTVPGGAPSAALTTARG